MVDRILCGRTSKTSGSTRGPVETICDAPSGRGGTWNQENQLVFAPDVNEGLNQISATGGTPKTITKPDARRSEQGHRWPYLAANFSGRNNVNNIFVASLDGESRLVVEAGAMPRTPIRGYLLYHRNHALVAQAFDQFRLKSRELLKRMPCSGNCPS